MTNSALDEIATRLGIAKQGQDWDRLDDIMPFLEKMRQEGSVIVIKMDGERIRESDGGAFTVIVSGQKLSGQPIRTDTDDLQQALTWIVTAYARRFWQSIEGVL
jgi:hypothetical protein